MKQNYQWKRFWALRDGYVDLLDGGYLSDPDVSVLRKHGEGAIPTEDVLAKKCVVLLGEPGIGKSTTLENSKASVEKRITDSADQLIWLDLRSFGDEKRVVESTFESSKFLRWSTTEGTLHIFLDSLDECGLRLSNLFEILHDGLREAPIDRLHLRLACRTAAWPSWFEEELKGLYKDIGVYELAPLRRIDVKEALEAEGLNSADALEKIDSAEAVPLAIKPVTLEMLMQVLRRDKRLPETRWDLYEHGCGILAGEVNQRRRHSNLSTRLTSRERFAIASRIGAVTVFGSRFAVWTGPDNVRMPAEDVPEHEIAVGTERVEDLNIRVDDHALRETIGTGLFTSRGPDRMGWAHLTLAEFCAARYLVTHEVSLSQICSLVAKTGSDGLKIVPQMREVSGWIAMRRHDLVDALASSDPEVLLRADGLDAATKKRLVAALLAALDNGTLHDLNQSIRDYGKLKHPELGRQLRPYISDPSKGIIVRRVAIGIARECAEIILIPELSQVALDVNQPAHLRARAIGAIGSVGNDRDISRLKLALNDLTTDPDDDVRGNLLRVLWPRVLTTRDLFDYVTAPKNPNLLGSYYIFLTTTLPSGVKSQVDLKVGLDWCFRNISAARPLGRSEIEILIDKILVLALDRLEASDIRAAFARVIVQRLRLRFSISADEHDRGLREAIWQDLSKRRQLLEASFDEALASGADPRQLYRLAEPADATWIIEKILNENDSTRSKGWVSLLGFTFSYEDGPAFEALFEGEKRNDSLREFLSGVSVIYLDSQLAKQLREHYALSQRQDRTESRPQPSPQELMAVLRKRIRQAEGGQSEESWIRFVYELRLTAPSVPRTLPELDLTSEPGWSALDSSERERALEVARKYLQTGAPNWREWITSTEIHLSALAGNRALVLLAKESLGSVETLSDDTLKKWLPSLVADFNSVEDKNLEILCTIIGAGYSAAKAEIIEASLLVLNAQKKQFLDIPVLRLLRKCWDRDDTLESALLARLNDPDLTPDQFGSLLGELLRNNSQEAFEFSKSVVSAAYCNHRLGRERAVAAARCILEFSGPKAWDFVWNSMRRDADFACLFMCEVAHKERPDFARFCATLGEQQLADLYLWIEEQFPRAQYDRNALGAHWVTPRESVVHFQEAILQFLRSKGTVESVAAIKRLVRELPGVPHLGLVLINAEAEARRKAWRPALPSEILKLADDSSAKLVNSGEQLSQLVLEALNRIQAEEVRGKTPQAKLLWNIADKGKVCRPKEEDELSDFLKRRLEDYIAKPGIVLNREVQLYRKPNAGRGYSSDIVVDASVSGKQDELSKVTAVVEVKGCWNRDLKTAMADQLINEYLKPTGLHHGLYVVCWFDPALWDDSDKSRKSKVPKWTLAEARAWFAKQAKELSNDGTAISSFVLDCSLTLPSSSAPVT